MLILEVEQGKEQGQKFTLEEPAVTLGRAETNQVRLTDFHLSRIDGKLP